MRCSAPRPWRAALRAAACAMALGSCGAGAAITLGDIEVRSALGEALDARIPVASSAGEAPRGACFSIADAGSGGLPAVSGATLELRRFAGGAQLRVRTEAALSEPSLALAITVACPGSSSAAERKEFALLLDPRPAGLPTVATLGAQPGDTLESLANKIVPRNRKARRAYLESMRAANPALAGLADADPLPANAKVALPDLRDSAQKPRAAPTQLASNSPAPRAEPRPKPAPAAPRDEPRAAPRNEPRAAPRDEPARAEPSPPDAPRKASAPGAFRLRLSAPVVDLAPSRAMDERQREDLRARLLVLAADDQMAAMLSMRESIRRLESRVTELQLKLAQMPVAAAAQADASPATATPQAPAPAPSKPAAPAPATATPEAAPVPTMPPAAAIDTAAPQTAAPPVPAPQTAAPPVPAPEAAAPSAAPPEVASTPSPAPQAAASAPPQPPAPAKAHAIPRPADAQSWYEASWFMPAVLGALAALLAIFLLLRGRWRAPEDEYYAPLDEAPTDAEGEGEEPAEESVEEPDAQAIARASPETAPATRVPLEDSAELRRRYIEERFPEIVNGTLVLEDPDSVVNAARLLYEDGAATRAIELLQFAIEHDPDAVKTWLALFEIFRLERLRGEFAQLAQRFGARHAATSEWRKVRQVGREIDPGNPLYEDSEVAERFDPAAENWLQSQAGSSGAALAAELRGGLMAGASLGERDLLPDPIPALRKSETFNVA